LIVPKDYGINGCLPKGSPPIIPFPFGRFSTHVWVFFFLLFSFGKKLSGKGAKEKEQLTKFFKAKNFRK